MWTYAKHKKSHIVLVNDMDSSGFHQIHENRSNFESTANRSKFNPPTGIGRTKAASIGFNCTRKRLALSKNGFKPLFSRFLFHSQIEIKNHARPNRNNSNIRT